MNVICRRARPDDREALIALWQEAFSDSQDEIECFLTTFEYEKTAFVLCEEESICSMLFMLPTAVQEGVKRFPAGYIYAGATKSASRGKGYYRHLLAFVAQTAKQEGTTALLLRPATESLADSYRRMGFSVPLYANSCPLNDSIFQDTLCASEYGALRRKLLSGQAFIDWDDRLLQYAFTWCRAGREGSSSVLYDEETVWERLPATNPTETALLMPLTKDFQTTAPIWFGYGLE